MKTVLKRRIEKLAFRLKDMPNSTKKHFSFLVLRSKIVSIGWNNAWKSNPWGKKYGHRHNCTHSEVAVLRNFQYPLSEIHNFELVNIRILNQNGVKYGMSRPCKKCENMIISLGIRGFWYTEEDGSWCYEEAAI